jgi:hypothetical protein
MNESLTPKITMKQAAAMLGTNLGAIIKLRAKGARLFDPTFPIMVNGQFDRAEILAWQAANASKSPAQPNQERGAA